MTRTLIANLALGLIGAVLCYFATTLAVWIGHYLPHRPSSRLREFHLGGHHKLYPDSRHTRTRFFLYGDGKNDSLIPLLPWVLGLVGIELALLPGIWRWAALGETAVIVGLHSHVHKHFHLRETWLQKYRWFRWARAVHGVHHDHDMNFMVADHFWDRMFGTYEPPRIARQC